LGRCYTSDRLCSRIQHLESHRSSYCHCHDLDTKFFAHQLTIMDNMIQAFWRNVRHAKAITDMDFHLLDFAQQQQQIATCNDPMTAPLHPRVAALFRPLSTTRRPREDSAKNANSTSMGNGRTEQAHAISNPKAESMFRLQSGSFFQDVFPPAAALRQSPKINGVSNYCRWQVSESASKTETERQSMCNCKESKNVSSRNFSMPQSWHTT